MATEKLYSPALVASFRENLRSDCQQAFDALVHYGSNAATLVDYLSVLKVVHRHHKYASPRMTRDELRSFVGLMHRASKALEKRFHDSEALQLAVCSDPNGTEAEFRNIPQRLLLVAQWEGDIHKGTARKRRPMYNDTLAELLWYIQIATKKQHLNEVAILVGLFTNRADYAFNELSSWKVDHKEELTRARLRLTGKS